MFLINNTSCIWIYTTVPGYVNFELLQVTTRAVKAGEVLFEERPLAVGPCPVTAPQCLQCGRKVDGSHLCPECGMPMCDEECSESSGHRCREQTLCNSVKLTKL